MSEGYIFQEGLQGKKSDNHSLYSIQLQAEDQTGIKDSCGPWGVQKSRGVLVRNLALI